MKSKFRPIAKIALAGAMTLGSVTAVSADAVAAAGGGASTMALVPVSCSNNAAARFNRQGYPPVHCYRGNGSRTVNLLSVTSVQSRSTGITFWFRYPGESKLRSVNLKINETAYFTRNPITVTVISSP
ncbi:hypothetical protein ACIBEJ_47605 [Nonomuraea sp. NPDC050790]|uniref:hypothetical protein n=1 Tax=Nonomuraea sp. NPDC050790 TaxID=3364371 RepID=UPI0037896012